jgi:hypothetical protein
MLTHTNPGTTMGKVKNVFFCLVQKGYTELEWLMPIFHSYRCRDVRITVLLPERAVNARQRLMIEWMSGYADHIVYGQDILKSNMFLKIRHHLLVHGTGLPARLVRRLIQTRFRQTVMAKKMSYYFNFLSTMQLRQILKNMDLVYFPEGAFPIPIPEGIAKLIRTGARILKKPLIGYIKSAYSDIRDLAKRNHGLDLLLVLSETDRQLCERHDLPAVVLGAQRFKHSWIAEISKHFASKEDAVRLKSMVQKKAVALVLLKNRTGLVQDFMSVEEHMEYRKLIFQALVKAGFHLLIKPHPAENSLPLEPTLEFIPADTYTVSEIPVQYLASLSLCSVCEMPSNSLMDVIANGKKSYWPFHLLNPAHRLLDQKEMTHLYLKSGFPQDFIGFVETDLPEKDADFALDNTIWEQFESLVNTQVDIDGAIRQCEQIVLKELVD